MQEKTVENSPVELVMLNLFNAIDNYEKDLKIFEEKTFSILNPASRENDVKCCSAECEKLSPIVERLQNAFWKITQNNIQLQKLISRVEL